VTSFGEKFDARTDVVERNDSLGAPPILLVQVVMDLYPVIAGALRLVKQSMKRIFTIVVISVGVMAATALLCFLETGPFALGSHFGRIFL
jgi:hypothetical protein